MTLSELCDALADLKVGNDDPEVYFRLGLQQAKINEIEYYPETDDEWSAVVISG